MGFVHWYASQLDKIYHTRFFFWPLKGSTEDKWGQLHGYITCAVTQGPPHTEGLTLALILFCFHLKILKFSKRSPTFLYCTGSWKLCNQPWRWAWLCKLHSFWLLFLTTALLHSHCVDTGWTFCSVWLDTLAVVDWFRGGHLIPDEPIGALCMVKIDWTKLTLEPNLSRNLGI